MGEEPERLRADAKELSLALAYRATGEYVLRAKKAEAECERLAGRVAALETALREITRTPSRDWHKNARIARAALDVGGSE